MAADSDFVAVETKLLVPERRAGFVQRPHLIEQLEAGRARRLTVVSAPTGFGKTSVLTEWGATSEARFAWVSLDEGDSDPARFWSYVAAAVATAAPELPGTSGRRLRGAGVSIPDEVLPVLVNELTMVARPLVLVLDDYHAIGADEVHAGVNYLLERLGPDVHVVIAGQTAPPLRLGRLRARDELNEYRAEQLRFSEEEVTALLNGTHGLELAAGDLSGLHRRTEGWVAGLNLVALTLRDSGDRSAFLAGLPVDDRFLVDYLWDEVVAQQTPETRDFLMRTAVLERLSSSLCDTVAGRSDSADMLLALERSNLFVVPLDAERRWFRYHTLFRAMLMRQLERLAPESVADLHRRASAWFADHGDLSGAIEHAICAGDVHVAADALRQNWLALYSGGHATEAIGWIDRLPAATVDEYPELALARGGMARAMGRIDEIEPWLDRAERAAQAAGGETERRELAAGVARQRAMLRLSLAEVGEAVRYARAAVALRPDGSAETMSDSFFLAVCLFWTGSTRECESLLRTYLETVGPGEQDVRRVFALALMSIAQAARGDLDAAQRLADESLATSEARGLSEHPPTEMVFVASGILALARDDLEGAEQRFEHAATLARRGGDRIEIAQSLLWLGRCRARGGDVDGAAGALESAQAQLDGARVPGLVKLADALEAAIAEHGGGGQEPEADGALTDAELRVLELLPSELTYREIADRLALPLETVRAHGLGIRRKLRAATRDEAVVAARRLELI
ncbi:MAG TPA: LuxR C-terminal-related transcriptional regulator [Solirubrobacteraceae bacterium]|nr:LuxR C-terminal-related transcriptional regulator [Solirubrobacteraceae bacterium]